MIRRIMQVEIEEEPDYEGVVSVTIRDPRTGKIVYNLLGNSEDWAPDD